MSKSLVRSQNDKMLFGVCAGLAEYVRIDPVIVRFAFVLLTILSLGWLGVLAYGILALVMPEFRTTEAKAYPFDEDEIIIEP